MPISPEELDDEDDEIDPEESYQEGIPAKDYIIPEKSFWQKILNMIK